MASVQLDRLFMSLADDPAQQVTCYSSDWSDVRATTGEVRTYAGGRRRVVTRAGTARTLGFTARLLAPADVLTLDGWRGRVVLVRDSRGRKVYGVYLSVPTTDRRDRGGQDVALTVESVDYDEAV